MYTFGGGKIEIELSLHKTLEYRDADDNLIIDCWTCGPHNTSMRFASVEAHVIAVNGPYGPFREGEVILPNGGEQAWVQDCG